MPVIKIDLQKIGDDLRAEVKKIEAADIPQGQKTTAHKRAVQKALNALYLDKRRYGGDKVENRITLSTFSRYLTKLRKMLEELNLHHHLLEREAERMKKRHPHHAPLFDKFLVEGASLADLRKAKVEAKGILKQEAELAAALNQINFAKVFKAPLLLLAKAHPDWADRLKALVDEEGRAKRLAEIRAVLDEVPDAMTDLLGLKIDHEAIVALKLPAGLKDEHLENADKRLERKQQQTLLVDYPGYMRKLGLLLTQPWNRSGDKTDWDFDMTVFALCGATGRRPIEIISLGRFERVDDHRLRFFGQAKKRDEGRDQGILIYSLYPTDLVMKAFNGLRELPYTQELALLEQENMRSVEERIANRVSNYLNQLARVVFAGVSEGRRLYDTRAIYARICKERWFDHDPRWQRINEDAFYSELLGHDDPAAQLNYKSIKLANFDRKAPKPEAMTTRLEALGELDHLMPDMANGDAAVRLHEWVKQQLIEHPGKVIHQTVLVREYGAYKPMAKRYMEACGGALLIREAGKGLDLSFLDAPITAQEALELDAETVERQVQAEELAAEQQEDTPELEAELEQEQDDATKQPEQADATDQPQPQEPELVDEQSQAAPAYPMPKFRFRGVEGGYVVTLTFGETEHQYQVEGSTIMDAGTAAWEAWLAGWEDVAIRSHRADGWVTLSALLPNGQLLEVIGRGKLDALRAQLIQDIEQAHEHYTAINH